MMAYVAGSLTGLIRSIFPNSAACDKILASARKHRSLNPAKVCFSSRPRNLLKSFYSKGLLPQKPFTPQALCAKSRLRQRPFKQEMLYTTSFFTPEAWVFLHQKPKTPYSTTTYTRSFLHQKPYNAKHNKNTHIDIQRNPGLHKTKHYHYPHSRSFTRQRGCTDPMQSCDAKHKRLRTYSASSSSAVLACKPHKDKLIQPNCPVQNTTRIQWSSATMLC